MIDGSKIAWDTFQLISYALNKAPYNDDRKSDWTPNIEGDCQQKTAWAQKFLDAVFAFPSERWVCTTESGKRHAVLIVRFDKEDWVIDCRYSSVQRKDILMYTRWLKVER